MEEEEEDVVLLGGWSLSVGARVEVGFGRWKLREQRGAEGSVVSGSKSNGQEGGEQSRGATEGEQERVERVQRGELGTVL